MRFARRGIGVSGLSALLLLGAAAWPSPVLAKNTGVKFEGRLGFGAAGATEGGSVEEAYELKLEVKTKRWKGFAALLELRTDEDSRALTIQDTYIDGKFMEGASRVRFGRGKRLIGWEYENPTSTRLSIERTAVSDFMAIRGVAGRDFFVRYSWASSAESEPGDPASEDEAAREPGTIQPPSAPEPAEAYLRLKQDAPLTLSAAVHYNETSDAALILGSVLSPSEDWRLGAWALVQRSRLPTRAIGTWGAAISSLYQPGRHRFELELFSGKDPYRSEVEITYGDGRQVSYWASRLAYGFQLGPVLPYFVGSYVSRDWSHPEDHTVQKLLGLRYFFNPALSISGEFDMINNSSITDPTSMDFDRNEIRIFARYFF